MTRSTCIQHPENEALIIIRQWQVALCEGNTCAASLLSFFEYWHSIKLELRQKAQRANAIAACHGDEGNHDETLIQFHTSEDLERGLMGLYKEDTIRKAIKYLVKRGFVEQLSNPNPRYAFDKTRHFQFRVDMVAGALNDYLLSSSKCSPTDEAKDEAKKEGRSPINPVSSPKNPSRCPDYPLRSPENPFRSPKNPSAIPEITTETTTEISIENPSAASVASVNTVSVDGWPRPEQILRDLEFLHGVDQLFAELQLVEFRSWWREKERFTTGEWDSKFLQRCVDQWDVRIARQQALRRDDLGHGRD